MAGSTYPALYPAYVVDSSAEPARVRIPQIYGEVIVPLFGFANIPPAAGEMGWVSFVNGSDPFGFKRDGQWIEPTLRYTAQEFAAGGVDDDPGKVRPGASVVGA